MDTDACPVNAQVSGLHGALEARIHSIPRTIRNLAFSAPRRVVAGSVLSSPNGPGIPAPRIGDQNERVNMPSWLLLIIVGVVLLILGVAVTAAHWLIWIGIAVLVISLILGLVNRGRSRV